MVRFINKSIFRFFSINPSPNHPSRLFNNLRFLIFTDNTLSSVSRYSRDGNRKKKIIINKMKD